MDDRERAPIESGPDPDTSSAGEPDLEPGPDTDPEDNRPLAEEDGVQDTPI